jgi:hypothetical protein
MLKNFYGNVDPRRKQELTDSRMVQEDHNAMANLSSRFIHREFNPDKFVEHLDMYNQDTRKDKGS